MLTCRQITELCTDFEEGSLSWPNWMLFKMHIRICPPCMEYVRQMQLTAESLSKLGPTDLDAEKRTELADLFRVWHDEE